MEQGCRKRTNWFTPTAIRLVPIDDEVAIAIECKSAVTSSRKTDFQGDIGKFALIRKRFANSANQQFPADRKHQIVLAMFLSNIQLSDNDRARAEAVGIQLFENRDLDYYEDLVGH